MIEFDSEEIQSAFIIRLNIPVIRKMQSITDQYSATNYFIKNPIRNPPLAESGDSELPPVTPK